MDRQYEISKNCPTYKGNCEECPEVEYCMLCCHHCKKIITDGEETILCIMCGEEVCMDCGEQTQKQYFAYCPEHGDRE